uniref:Uncharacterized protein n=1 Tax=Anguilla anguilla TaxID=7936 RepID=A0A0E9URB2_ANGAN
MYLNPGQIYI